MKRFLVSVAVRAMSVSPVLLAGLAVVSPKNVIWR